MTTIGSVNRQTRDDALRKLSKSVLYVLMVVSALTHRSYAAEIKCLTLVETGETLSNGRANYYDRFDENPKRVVTTFNFEQLYLISFAGRRFDLVKVSDDLFVLQQDPRYKYLAKLDGNLVVEVRVEKDSTTSKVFECTR